MPRADGALPGGQDACLRPKVRPPAAEPSLHPRTLVETPDDLLDGLLVVSAVFHEATRAIVHRLERSFDLEQRLKEAVDWNSEWYQVTHRLVDAFELALDEISGKPLKAFKEATRQVRQPPVPPWERNE